MCLFFGNGKECGWGWVSGGGGGGERGGGGGVRGAMYVYIFGSSWN